MSSSPFKGEARRGMGMNVSCLYPIPTPALPLKGREFWGAPSPAFALRV